MRDWFLGMEMGGLGTEESALEGKGQWGRFLQNMGGLILLLRKVMEMS